MTTAIGRVRVCWTNAVGAHHFIVLVLHNVTVPDELAGYIEPGFDASYFAGVRDDRILEPQFPGLRRTRLPFQSDWCDRLLVIASQLLSIQHFEHHFVNMHWVGIWSEVIEFPDLGVPDIWIFCDRLHPHLFHGLPIVSNDA